MIGGWSVGDAIYYGTKYMDGKRTLREIVDTVMFDIKTRSLDVLSSRPVGNYAAFRGLELGAAINRLRTLAVRIR